MVFFSAQQKTKAMSSGTAGVHYPPKPGRTTLDMGVLLERLQAPVALTREPVPEERASFAADLLAAYKKEELDNVQVCAKLLESPLFDRELLRSHMLVLPERYMTALLPSWTEAFQAMQLNSSPAAA